MLRFFNLIFMGALILVVGFVYNVKYEATFDTAKITKLNREIAREQDRVNRLKAEWAYLNRPEYLQPIVEKHMTMQPMALSQFGLVGLRERPAVGPDPLTRMLEALERADHDIITAKIKKPSLVIKEKPQAKPALKPLVKLKNLPKQQTLADVIAGLNKPIKAKP